VTGASSGEVRASPVARWDTVVIGAGVFGAWTAWQLRRRGQNVLLVDAWGPSHDRASSGGESRLTRTTYGAAALYSQMAWQSLEQWRWLSASQELPLFHPIGVLFFFPRVEPYVTQTLEVHRALGIPLETLERPALAKRFPQISWEGVDIGLYEPTLGALMARRAVQSLVAIFVRDGGHYRQAAIAAPAADGASRLSMISTAAQEALRAERYVFACGAWLPKLFPQVLGSRIFPTRQEVFFFTPPPGDTRFEPGALPGWADFNEGDIFYGFPDLEGRGFKIANHPMVCRSIRMPWTAT
jgi:sarcosine oxidase